MLIHNPLWAAQEVGPLTALNWLLPAYGVPLAVLWMAGRLFPGVHPRLEQVRTIAQMLLILLLSAPGVTASEDVLRSVSAIAIAIGFLLWGLRGASPRDASPRPAR